MIKEKLLEFTFFRGRVALYVMLKALGIGKGDMVACQAFTCIAVPEAIIATGARPLYVDVEKDGYNMDPKNLEKRITVAVKAVIVQHSYGIPAKIDKILKILSTYDIPVIEDCCLSLFSSYKGKELGTFGIASFYSYEWGKPLIAGIGGSLVLNDNAYYKKVKLIAESFLNPPLAIQWKIFLQYICFSMFYTPESYWFTKNLFHIASKKGLGVGNFNDLNSSRMPLDYNYHMIPFCKAMLKIKIKRLKKNKDYIIKVMKIYNNIIMTNKYQTQESPNNGVVLSRLPIILKTSEEKQIVLIDAKKINIEISDWYFSAIHPLKDGFEKVFYIPKSCPNAEYVAARVITFPVNLKTKNKHVDKIGDIIKKRRLN